MKDKIKQIQSPLEATRICPSLAITKRVQVRAKEIAFPQFEENQKKPEGCF